MKVTDFDQRTPTRKLSGGTRRKLSFLISIFSQPEAVLLDEPTTGMDPVSRRKLWEIIKSEVRGKMGAILTTHFMEEADVLCDAVGIMVHGSMR
jgi:ATP-binding cassette subfamily A (ABC1) protein 5